MSLFSRLAAGTGFRRFMDFVSPAFFDVMPMGKLMGEVKAMVSGYRDAEGFADRVEARAANLDGVGVTLDLEAEGTDPTTLEEGRRKAVGEAVLRLYFRQLRDGAPVLVDLSKERFVLRGEELCWRPGRGHAVWSDDFRRQLVAVYRGYYHEGGDGLRKALVPLGLESATDVFRSVFGEGDQSAVTFSVESFVDAFHRVFVHCKERGIELDPHFMGLGIYLATMYETLDALGMPLDVRGAYCAADPVPARATPGQVSSSA